KNQQTVINKPFLPNDDVNQGQQQEINTLITDVTQTWEDLYQRQREEALVWPTQLSSSFRNYVSTRKFGDEIDARQRQDYFDYISGRFDDLPKIINANEIDASTTAIGGTGGYQGEGGFGGASG